MLLCTGALPIIALSDKSGPGNAEKKAGLYGEEINCDQINWAVWENFYGDSATATINNNGTQLKVTMTANYTFGSTPAIYDFENKLRSYPGAPPNTRVPMTTWATEANGTTTMCFNETVEDPVLLLASLGGTGGPSATLSFSKPYTVIFDGGNMEYHDSYSLTGTEGYALIMFPGEFTCLTVNSTTPEYYTNITWGLKPRPFEIDVQAVSVNCNTAVFTATGAASYTWNGGDSPNDATNSFHENGTYLLTATNAEGCQSTVPVTVTLAPSLEESQPTFTFDYPDNMAICNGDSTVFEVQGDTSYLYQWYLNGMPIDGATGQRYVAREAGDYHVGVALCPSTVYHSKIVTVELVIVEAPERNSESGTFCLGSTLSLTLSNYSGRETIQWYLNDEPIPGANGVTYYATEPGYYNISLSYLGCTAMSLPYLLQYDPPLEVSFDESIRRLICRGQETEITAAVAGNLDGIRFQWSTGATTPGIMVNQPGDYTLTVTNSRGCSTSASITIDQFPDMPSFTLPDTIICYLNDEVLRLEAPSGFASYRWNGEESNRHWIEITQEGHYELLVTDHNGCTALHTFSVSAYCDDIFIPNIFSPNGDGINDTWNISGLEGEDGIRIRIFSRTGQLITDTSTPNPAWDGTINGSAAPEGAYYYLIERTSQRNQQYKGSLTLIR